VSSFITANARGLRSRTTKIWDTRVYSYTKAGRKNNRQTQVVQLPLWESHSIYCKRIKHTDAQQTCYSPAMAHPCRAEGSLSFFFNTGHLPAARRIEIKRTRPSPNGDKCNDAFSARGVPLRSFPAILHGAASSRARRRACNNNATVAGRPSVRGHRCVKAYRLLIFTKDF